eukprot:scaffold4079_cov167-Amphora_coffeaeformis.AAC.5
MAVLGFKLDSGAQRLRRNGGTIGSYFVNIYSRRNQSSAIIVEATSVASSLIGVQVDSAAFSGGRHNQLQALIQFSQRMVASAAVSNQLDTLQG